MPLTRVRTAGLGPKQYYTVMTGVVVVDYSSFESLRNQYCFETRCAADQHNILHLTIS